MNKKNATNSSQLDVQQAAQYLSVSVGTIRRWAHNKQLKGVKVGLRGDWRFTTDELSKLATTNHSSSHLLTNQPSPEKNSKKSEHFVQFYEEDTSLLDSLSSFIRIGLSMGEICIVVATKAHRQKLEKQLRTYGLDIKTLQAQGQYIPRDAAETLAKFMVDGSPDPKQFFQIISPLITSAAEGQRVRIFGEMVALLWAQGNEASTLHLEKLWNDIGTMYSFSLLCAYPMHGFGKASHSVPFVQINSRHARVIPAESYTAITTWEEQLRAVSILQQKVETLEGELKKNKQLEKNHFLKGGENI